MRSSTQVGNPLANSLSIVARLIKGQLGARIYHVTLGGFDTHANQVGHPCKLIDQFVSRDPCLFAGYH